VLSRRHVSALTSRFPTSLALLALSTGLAAACTYDFDAAFGGATGGSTSTTGGSGGVSTGGTGAQGAASTGGDGGAGTTGGAPTGGNGGAGTGGGFGGGAGGMPTGGGPMGGASMGGGTISNQLDCGNTPCPLGGNNACCWDEYQGHSQPFADCIDEALGGGACRTAANPNNGLESRIECQYPLQCDMGEVCCAVLDSGVAGMPFYDRVHCRATCSAPNSRICDPINPACGGNENCAQSSLLPSGYSVCIPN